MSLLGHHKQELEFIVSSQVYLSALYDLQTCFLLHFWWSHGAGYIKRWHEQLRWNSFFHLLTFEGQVVYSLPYGAVTSILFIPWLVSPGSHLTSSPFPHCLLITGSWHACFPSFLFPATITANPHCIFLLASHSIPNNSCIHLQQWLTFLLLFTP